MKVVSKTRCKETCRWQVLRKALAWIQGASGSQALQSLCKPLPAGTAIGGVPGGMMILLRKK